MGIYNAFLIAFATYSRIPVPQADWKEENMRYAVCFFPLVGAVIGGASLLWQMAAAALELNTILTAAVFAVIPTVITGGIHLDGFCDTTDALSSYQPPERRLEILKDPRAGAFAVIWTVVYYLVYFALFTEVTAVSLKLIALGFVLSRALSGFGVVTLKSARKNGMVASFAESAHHRRVAVCMILFFAAAVTCMLFVSPISGAVAAAGSVIVFLCYKRMAYKNFGGVTGDLAGYFLILCELYIAASAVIFERLVELWS